MITVLTILCFVSLLALVIAILVGNRLAFDLKHANIAKEEWRGIAQRAWEQNGKLRERELRAANLIDDFKHRLEKL